MSETINLLHFEKHGKSLLDNGTLDETTYFNICKRYSEGLNMFSSIAIYLAMHRDFYIDDNSRVVVIEKNLKDEKRYGIVFENCEEINQYINYLGNLAVYAQLNKNFFRIKREVEKGNIRYTAKDFEVPVVQAKKSLYIEDWSGKRQDKLMDNSYLESEILNTIKNLKTKTKGDIVASKFRQLISKNNANKPINFDNHRLHSDEINHVLEKFLNKAEFTIDQSAALKLYKADFYIYINTFLNYSNDWYRESNSHRLGYGFPDYVKNKSVANAIELIFEALKQSTINENIIIYRGERYFNKELKIGDTIEYDNFISTSASKSTAKQHSLEVIYSFELPKGSKCIHTDCLKREKISCTDEVELLLPPMDFKITEINKDEKVTQYDKKERYFVRLMPLRQKLEYKSILKKANEYWEKEFGVKKDAELQNKVCSSLEKKYIQKENKAFEL